jgi:hypothetical protein
MCVNKGRKERILARIETYLRERGSATVAEIVGYLNSSAGPGVTSAQVSSLIARSKRFIKVGVLRVNDGRVRTGQICEWGIY